MEHIYIEGKSPNVFVLLHGTGGTEHDLLPLAETLNPDFSILSVRGEIQENGMNRFFKRHGEGKYDLQDLEKRGESLFQFIREQSLKHDFKMENIVFVGFSNGSNIAVNMLLKEEAEFKRAVLFAPMYPVDITENTKDMSELKVFLSLGNNDPMVPEAESERVIRLFKERHAKVSTTFVEGHRLTNEAVLKAREWLNK